jgi:hypothetical protein
MQAIPKDPPSVPSKCGDPRCTGGHVLVHLGTLSGAKVYVVELCPACQKRRASPENTEVAP